MHASYRVPRRRGSMKPCRHALLSLIASSLPLALAIVIATPTPALALGDWIGVEGSFWHQSQDGKASIDGSILNGTTIDFQDTLGLDKTDNPTMGRVWFRLTKTRLIFDYFDSSRSGSTTLGQTFVFDDTLYTTGHSLQRNVNLKVLRG